MADILLIDDMAGVRRSVSSILEGSGHSVTAAKDGSQGLALLQQRAFDLVITDTLMPNVSGVEVLSQLNALPSRPLLISMSGGGAGKKMRATLQAMRENSDCFLEKPIEKDDLIAAVDQLLAARVLSSPALDNLITSVEFRTRK